MTLRRTLPVLAGLAIAALAAPAAHAAQSTITMPGKYFDPPRTVAVAGDTVTWRNADLVTHDVRVAAGLYDSGPMGRGATWSVQFGQPGQYPFVCTLHAFMAGNLDVVAATLAAESEDVLAGEPLTLTGRAPAGTDRVGLERSINGGPWTPDGAGVTPAADGTFSVATAAAEGAAYRVTTPAGASPVVTPRVTARVDVHVSLRRGPRRLTVAVHTMPATTGLTATLQLYARWHYRWRNTQRVKLDDDGAARFRLPARRRAYARVVLRRGPRGPALVTSDVIKTWNGRRAQDPDTITPPMPGAGGHTAH